MMRNLLAFAAAAALAGCVAGSQTVVTGSFDAREKSMTVPPGNAVLFGIVKQRLRQDGWRLVVSGPMRTVGTDGPETDLRTFRDNGTRYRLVGKWQQFDTCLVTGQPAIYYDLSVLDNATGEEVIAQSGSDCAGLAADKFMAAIVKATR